MNATVMYNNNVDLWTAPRISSAGYSLGGYSSNPLCQKICDSSYAAACLPQAWDATFLQLPSDVDQQLDLLCEGLPAVPTVPDVTNGNIYAKDFQPGNTASMGLYLAQKAFPKSCAPIVPKTSATGSSDMSDASWDVISKCEQTICETGVIKVQDQDGHSDFDSFSQKYDSSNDEEDKHINEGELSKEPWFRTLKSAGVRIKGRTKQELVQVAERIRKRRRESAARSRARRTDKVSTIADQNKALRQENQELKRLIEQIQTRQAGRGGLMLQNQSEIGF